MHRVFFVAAILVLGAATARAAEDDIVIADFEGKDYGAWKVEGEAFGPGPAQGTLPHQMPVSGYLGRGLVNSFFNGDDTTGRLTSPELKIERRYINFLIGGGKKPGVACINLLVDGKVVRTATGPNDRPGGSEALDWASWDVADLAGKTARIEIVDEAKGGWGHINVDQIVQSSQKMEQEVVTDVLYRETYRPQFHFTAAKNWLNDPNGCVFYKGEWHLFFQHNPVGLGWGDMTWGHAVSRDLVRWEQLPNAIEPDAMGQIWSGSAVVDWDNTAGFQKGDEKTLVAIYTAAGGKTEASKGKPFTQCITYSTDRGRTWTKYEKNPVLGHVAGESRDPKLAWHAPTKRWIMALYKEGDTYAFFASPDLKAWTHLEDLKVPGCGECPDFFEMPVEGRAGEKRWVFTAANGRYLVGTFDGKHFAPEDKDALPADWGANYYAVQTWSDLAPEDGRRIQIAWMSGGQYPKMPFNQQMSFPCEMKLRALPEGLRICRTPVKEIELLHDKEVVWEDVKLLAGEPVSLKAPGDLLHIRGDFALCSPGEEIVLTVRGEPIRFNFADREAKVSCLGRSAPIRPGPQTFRFQVLVDRTSLEVFGDDGRVSMTSCFLPRKGDEVLTFSVTGGAAHIIPLKVWTLKSAWALP